VVDVGAIGQEHIGKGALVLVEAMSLKRNFFPKGEIRSGVLGVVVKGLAFLRAIDPAEADAFRALVVQDFEGLAIGDVGGEVSGARSSGPLLSWSFFCSVGALTFPLGQLGGW
jgi:hypothetical protein